MDEESPNDEASRDDARRLFAGTCTFVAGAARAEGLPAASLPEVAFAGRSNVGKSRLINALTGRKALARTSSTPGRTQQINFYDLGGRLMLADLPGYGYARASKGRIRAWTRLVTVYFEGRASLRRVVLLVDSRRGIGDPDREVMTALDKAGVSYQVVLTKGDKGSEDETDRAVSTIGGELARRPAAHPEVLVTSARTGAGIAELRAALAALADPRPSG